MIKRYLIFSFSSLQDKFHRIKKIQRKSFKVLSPILQLLLVVHNYTDKKNSEKKIKWIDRSPRRTHRSHLSAKSRHEGWISGLVTWQSVCIWRSFAAFFVFFFNSSTPRPEKEKENLKFRNFLEKNTFRGEKKCKNYNLLADWVARRSLNLKKIICYVLCVYRCSTNKWLLNLLFLCFVLYRTTWAFTTKQREVYNINRYLCVVMIIILQANKVVFCSTRTCLFLRHS